MAKKFNLDSLKKIAIQSGISGTTVSGTAGTFEISLARQLANSDKESVALDDNNLSELEESLRIGAGISKEQSKNVVSTMKEWAQKELKSDKIVVKRDDKHNFIIDIDDEE